MSKRRLHVSLAILSLLLGVTGITAVSAFPLTQALNAIEEVRIEGNRRVPESTIRYYVKTQAGGPYDKRQIFLDYWRLLGTKFFSEVDLDVTSGDSGAIVTFQVQERQLIREIQLRGAPFNASELKTWFQETGVNLTVDSPFDETRLPAAKEALLQLLEIRNVPVKRVDVEIDYRSESSLNVIFHVREP